MKKYLFFIFSMLSMLCSAQVGEICNWDENKAAAVVLTFDDWLTTHPTVVVPALQERNMTATFYFIAKDMSSTKGAQLRKAVELGNEIGNHSYTHPQADSAIAVEVRKAKQVIDSALGGQYVYTFDYPYGTVSNMLFDTVRESGHIAARGVWSPANYRYNFASTVNDYYNIRTVGVGGSGVTTTKAFASHLTKIINGGGLLTYLYHGVAKSGDYANVTKEIFYEELDTIQSLRSKLWVTTLANAVKYHREKLCANLQEIEKSEKCILISLTDTLPDSIYNQPLTLKIYNQGKTFNRVYQGKEENDCPIVFQNYEYVLFRALPDGGDICLEYGDWDVTAVSQVENDNTVRVTNHVITVTTTATASVVVYSAKGAVIAKKTGSCQLRVDKVGTYIVSIDSKSQKIVIK